MIEQITKAQTGDRDAFSLLMDKHRQVLYRIARSFFRERMDVEDAISQTVLDCWTKLGSLKKPEYFKTWLIRILINNCNDILRRRAPLLPLDEVSDLPYPEPEPCDPFEEMMRCLSDRVRPVMELYYGQEYKIKEIAQLLHIPAGTVSTRLHQGRKQLEHILTERGWTE